MKKAMLLLSCLVLLLTSLSGCLEWVPEFVPPPPGPARSPHNPALTTDSQGDVSIIWNARITEDAYGYMHIYYTKVNKNNSKSESNPLVKMGMHSPKILRDSMDAYNLFYLSHFVPTDTWVIYYLKINPEEKILINPTSIVDTEFDDILDESVLFDATVDKSDCLHIIWINKNLTIGYMKLNTNGTILLSKELNSFFDNITFSFGMIDFPFHIDIDSRSVIHAVWQNGYNTFNTTTGTVGKINNSIFGDAIKIDSKDNTHVISAGNYKKISSNGTVLISENIANVSVIPGFPVVSDDSRYIYIGDNGCVGPDSNIHIVSEEKVMKTWRSGRYWKMYFYYTIYYTKLSSNGTVLVDRMVIDTDGEPSWETSEYTSGIITTILLAVGVACAVLLSVIIVSLLLKRRKKKGG